MGLVGFIVAGSDWPVWVSAICAVPPLCAGGYFLYVAFAITHHGRTGEKAPGSESLASVLRFLYRDI